MWLNLDPAEAAEVKELNSMSDRAAAIVGAAIVENRLLELLRFTLPNLKIREQVFLHDRMLGGSQPLGSFSARINLGFMLNLYDESAWRDLDNMRDLRNDFAHKTSIRSFAERSVIDRCANFRTCDANFQEPAEGKNQVAEIDGVAFGKLPKITIFIPGIEENKKNAKVRYLMAVQYYSLLLKLPTVLQWGSRKTEPAPQTEPTG